MNKRIDTIIGKALDQAVPYTWHHLNHVQVDDIMKKFAELIVRECMDLALSEQKRYAAFTHRNLSECAVTVSNFRLLMKDHFGVK